MTSLDAARLLEAILHALAGIRPAAPDTNPHERFDALGLDSLDRLTMAVRLEQSTGLTVTDQILADATSPHDLTRRLLTTTRSTPMDKQPDTLTPPLGWCDPGGSAAEGTRLWHQAQIAADAAVGADCTLGKGAFIGAGSTIGDRVKIGNYASVFGATISDDAMICPGALLLEDPAPRATTPDGRRKGPKDWHRAPARIGPGATVGAGAVIAAGVTIGAHAMVGLGAVVLRDVPAHGLVLGNPARQVGWVCQCGHTLTDALHCRECPRVYQREASGVTEAHPEPSA